MKNFIQNKILIVVLTLVSGILIGWWIKPSNTIDEHADHSHSENLGAQIWTCSMHPQVRLNEAGDCPICGMDLIPADEGNSGENNPYEMKMSSEAVALSRIQTQVVGLEDSNKNGLISLSGKIQTDERTNATISAKFPGRIEKLFVNFTGESIRKGQKLASIYSPELLSAQQELIEASKMKSSYPNLYQAAVEKLRLWKLTDIQIQAIESAAQVQDTFEIFADQTGVVTQRNVSVGDYVDTGSSLFQLANLEKLWVMLDAYESDLEGIRVGDEISFTTLAVSGKEFKTRVSFIDPIIDPNTRSAALRAEIDNAAGVLKPEMLVKAEIKTGKSQKESTIQIPRTALLWSGKRSIVYVKIPSADSHVYEMREVSIGSRQGDFYPILSGLEKGEEIVVNGAFAIDAAAQLAGKSSLLNRTEKVEIPQSEAFSNALNKLVDQYFEIKNELVGDRWERNAKWWEEMRSALNTMSTQESIAAQKSDWEKALDALERSNSIKEARTNFATLSNLVLEINEAFGLQNRIVYKDYCPMAFGDQGAFWLSEKKEILNPYFGSSMLTCGEVKETYRN